MSQKKSCLRLSPTQRAAKILIGRAKKRVKFHKIIHQKKIPLLPSYKGRTSDDWRNDNSANSFMLLTDNSRTPTPRNISFAENFQGSPLLLSFSESPILDKKKRRRSTVYRPAPQLVYPMRSPTNSSPMKAPQKKLVSPPPPPSISMKAFVFNTPKYETKTIYEDYATEPKNDLAKSIYNRGIKAKEAFSKHTLWSDAFAVKNEADIIRGPYMDGFVNWLQRWKKRLATVAKINQEPPKKKQRKSRRRNEDSDDEDYTEELEITDLPTTCILSGTTGCGKTSFVHFYAKQNGFNVIELSASDDRSAIAMKNVLSGAIESHAVRGPGDIRSMFGHGVKRSTDFKPNLILIDDADVVFKADTFFWPKLSSYCVESKIPIVLTCTHREIVLGRLDVSDYVSFNFWKRDTTEINKHFKNWIMGFAGKTFENSFLKEIVNESKQDIRQAINNLQFYAQSPYHKQDEPCRAMKMSSKQLAELDVALTTCEHRERKSKIRWTAKELSDINFIPDKCNLRNWNIPNVDNINEWFISDLNALIFNQKASDYAEYEKKDIRLAASLHSCRGVSAPILPAVYDAFKRQSPSSSLRISSLYELPHLALIHRSWCSRNGNHRRAVHPFEQVNTELGKCLDHMGNLKQTITEYLLPNSAPDEHVDENDL